MHCVHPQPGSGGKGAAHRSQLVVAVIVGQRVHLRVVARLDVAPAREGAVALPALEVGRALDSAVVLAQGLVKGDPDLRRREGRVSILCRGPRAWTHMCVRVR